MKRLSLKTSLLLIVFIIFFIPVITSSLLDLEQSAENEIIRQRNVAEKEAKEKQEKIYLMGKFDPAERSDFTAIPGEYNVAGHKMYLRKETLYAFAKMAEAAALDGVKLSIASATRNFEAQKTIWNNKWSGLILVDGKKLNITIPDGLERFNKILEYSSVPGTSRHHWGTDIDINDATPEYFQTPNGAKVYEWLTKNAPNFGFCEPYNPKGPIRPEGYFAEKWHWSYKPLSKNFTEEYERLIKDEDITGFFGDQYALELNLPDNYIAAINPECL